MCADYAPVYGTIHGETTIRQFGIKLYGGLKSDGGGARGLELTSARLLRKMNTEV